jgi:hypothetical protein
MIGHFEPNSCQWNHLHLSYYYHLSALMLSSISLWIILFSINHREWSCCFWGIMLFGFWGRIFYSRSVWYSCWWVFIYFNFDFTWVIRSNLQWYWFLSLDLIFYVRVQSDVFTGSVIYLYFYIIWFEVWVVIFLYFYSWLPCGCLIISSLIILFWSCILWDCCYTIFISVVVSSEIISLTSLKYLQEMLKMYLINFKIQNYSVEICISTFLIHTLLFSLVRFNFSEWIGS